MSIETYGTGERLKTAARLIAPYAATGTVILLPVPTTRDGVSVANTDILLSDTLLNASRGSLIVGYGLPHSYKASAEALGASVLELSDDEEFILENAYITALGALGYILTTVKRAPSLLTFGVFGYGRIGKAIVRMLLFLGASVRVYTSKEQTRMELGECCDGLLTVSDSGADVCDFSNIDVLINTAPCDMRARFPSGRLLRGLRVIELASGKNFEGIEGVESLPSLPDRMYPESAGQAYFSAIQRFMNSVGDRV